MNISISEHNQERIRRKVESGEFASADELLEKALEALKKRTRKTEAMRQEIQAGFDSGDPIPGREFMESLRRRAVADLEQG
jgi:putative addiction module CopG family antidote